MTKKPAPRTYDDVLALLGSQHFDCSAADSKGATGRTSAVRVSKYGCAAVIGPAEKGAPTAVLLLQSPGFLLGGEISRILDRGYQKFLRTSKLEIPATAQPLRALHDFKTELNAATGEMTMFNEAMGTTSNTYEYDRVLGRPDQPVR